MTPSKLREGIEGVIKDNGVECLPDSTSPHPFYVYPEQLSKALTTYILDNLEFGEKALYKIYEEVHNDWLNGEQEVDLQGLFISAICQSKDKIVKWKGER